MALPAAIRRRMPDRLRHSARARALALRTGLVPPRTMHSPAESALLAELARGRRRAVEIGVYEGSSALVLAGALPLDAELHLVEPFGAGMEFWEPADEHAVKAVVARATRRRGGPHAVGTCRRARRRRAAGRCLWNWSSSTAITLRLPAASTGSCGARMSRRAAW
jgi:hypothetical protein